MLFFSDILLLKFLGVSPMYSLLHPRQKIVYISASEREFVFLMLSFDNCLIVFVVQITVFMSNLFKFFNEE